MPPWTNADVVALDAALRRAVPELEKKSLHQIQRDTALTWCGRAIGAKSLGLHADAIEYAHESIEHAALSGDDALLALVRTSMRQHGIPV